MIIPIFCFDTLQDELPSRLIDHIESVITCLDTPPEKVAMEIPSRSDSANACVSYRNQTVFTAHESLYRFLQAHVTTEDLKNITKIELKNLKPIKLVRISIGYELYIIIFFKRGINIFSLQSTIHFDLGYRCTRLLIERPAMLLPTRPLLSITPDLTPPAKGPKFSVSTAARGTGGPRKLKDYIPNIQALPLAIRDELYTLAWQARPAQNKMTCTRVVERIEDQFLALPLHHPDRVALCQGLPATNETIKEIFYYIFEAVYNGNTAVFV